MVKKSPDITFPVLENEENRLAKLEEYNILDTLPEEEFDALVELAALITGSPISLMNILGHNRQWTKAAYGEERGTSRSRSDTVCQYTILEDNNLEVEDLTQDDRFKDKTFVAGEPHMRSYSGYPLKTPEGYNLGALCVIDLKPKTLDVIQKKSLKTLADEIMARLELRKNQRHLEELNKEKDQLIRAINHDIKSPLNGIVGSTHYLQNVWDGDRDELFKMLDMIEMSGRKLINYTSELVNNSLQSRQAKLHLEKVNIDELIKDLIHIYRPLAKTKQVTIKLNHEDSAPFFLDDEKFKLIISNLMSNALKFSSEGDTISLYFEINDGNVRELKCYVADTGIGIPDDFIPTLFTSNKKNQRKGTQGEISTGLGLPIIKQMVELHGGTIQVETEEGKGSTFYVTIPEQTLG